MSSSASEHNIQSLDRAFDIIENLSENNNDGLPLAQLCANTGLNKSTVHRMLASLKNRGYVVQTASGNYRLTFKFCSLSQRLINNTGRVSLFLPHVKRLCNDTQEIVHLVIQDGDDTVYLDREEPANPTIRTVVNVGMRRPMHTSATGKSILSIQDPAVWAAYWEKAPKEQITPYTIMDFPRLQEELERARRMEYAIDNEENTLGIRCIAVPLFDRYNKNYYAISISAAKSRMTDERIQTLLPLLFATRDQIITDIGL